MATKTTKFILVGPHKGRTMAINGREFVDGEHVFHGSAEQAAVLAGVLRFYGAYPEDVAARMAEPEPEQKSAPAVGGDSGEGAPDEAAKPDLAEAIGMLDAEDDAHWTSNNLPSLDFLSEKVGRKVSRADVEAAAEGYTRAKARMLA